MAEDTPADGQPWWDIGHDTQGDPLAEIDIPIDFDIDTTIAGFNEDVDLSFNIGASEVYPLPAAASSHSDTNALVDLYSDSSLKDGEMAARLVSNLPQAHGIADKTEPAKVGARFSSRSVKVLRSWFMTHAEQPYPRAGDIVALQRETGLGKQQISNWFANARRRTKKFQPQNRLPTTRATDGPASAAPQRPGSPAPFQNLDPLQRWQNSPPESEPASVSAISRALSSFESDSNCPYGVHSTERPHDQAAGLYHTPSESSGGTSQSSGSPLSSLHSYTSGSSSGYPKPLTKLAKRRRRRYRAGRAGPGGGTTINQTLLQPFQCTFCTETFKTKYNWKRHEKSFHLSLEKWQCTPSGPTFTDAHLELACVYCGLVNPDPAHLAEHDHAACGNRSHEERTFYRKDHLRQHLKLVHRAHFRACPMEQWKCEDQQIRSRCGICGLAMTTWLERSEHIADHFKGGKTMGDWHGDWGFEAHVLDMVENSMPPYLIHYERYSPWPFTTQQGPPETPTSAFELIEIELEYYATSRENGGRTGPGPPSDEELQYEACCIIFGSEMLMQGPGQPAASWLRDVLMSSPNITREARVRPMKTAAKTRLTLLKIKGKGSIFEACDMEDQLRQYAGLRKLLDLEVGDHELQSEACSIVLRTESCRPSQCGVFVNLLLRLIRNSTGWLTPFRQRANLLPVSAHPASDNLPPMLPAMGFMADCLPETPDNAASSNHSLQPPLAEQSQVEPWLASSDSFAAPGQLWRTKASVQVSSNDDNCYRRLTRELSRFVATTMSTRNPNRHVPTDEELQYQARWIMFNDDDPWNQTPVDNADWLREFKRGAGLPSEDGPPGR